MWGERPGEATDAAAEVERSLTADWAAEPRRRSDEVLDLGLAGGEELAQVPDAAALPIDREDGPERIDERKVVPVPCLAGVRRAG
jgi:hypothetical protein